MLGACYSGVRFLSPLGALGGEKHELPTMP
jgi:hypothetical protein